MQAQTSGLTCAGEKFKGLTCADEKWACSVQVKNLKEKGPNPPADPESMKRRALAIIWSYSLQSQMRPRRWMRLKKAGSLLSLSSTALRNAATDFFFFSRKCVISMAAPRPSATSACGLTLLVHAAFSY